jgi:hypothetical protein
MKTSPLSFLIAAALAPAALLSFGCSKSSDATATVEQVKADASAAVVDVRVAMVDSWDRIKDCTFEKRSDFSSGLGRMSDSLDEKLRASREKVAGMSDAASRGREAAVKDYDEARADLKTKISDLGNASAETWSSAKAKTAESWKRVQSAYEKVKSGPSS